MSDHLLLRIAHILGLYVVLLDRVAQDVNILPKRALVRGSMHCHI